MAQPVTAIRALNRIGYDGPLSGGWEGPSLGREHDARESAAFVRRADFEPSAAASTPRSEGNSMKKLKIGMVGGGSGAFIGAVHRRAAIMDGEVEFSSSSPEPSPRVGRKHSPPGAPGGSPKAATTGPGTR